MDNNQYDKDKLQEILDSINDIRTGDMTIDLRTVEAPIEVISDPRTDNPEGFIRVKIGKRSVYIPFYGE